ncbi:MAG: Uma2 family endonuclease [Syntrophobacteraceae bacterium]
MSEPAKNRATYEDLYQIPENMTGEIIDGKLIATPRPARRHTLAASHLGGILIPPYHFGRGGGPGGWIIIIEPEIGLGEDILVPDLAGWKKERFPIEEEHNWISAAPDWVCEILSPKSFRTDKIEKMPIYARHNVGHIWLIDPISRTMDAFRLESGRWSLLASFAEEDEVRIEPFEQIAVHLADLWLGR